MSYYEASRVDASTWRVRRWKVTSEQLHEALESANSICRSASAIANRDGQATNWETFRGVLHKSLELQHRAMYPQQYRPFDDEAILRDMPADTTEEQAIQVAVERNSWA